MPGPSVLLVRLAFVHLLLGLGAGSLLLVAKGMPQWSLLSWGWRAAHVELLVVGFTIQLALGVAFWILPRDADRPPAQLPAVLVAAFLNAGLLMVAAGLVERVPMLQLIGRLAEATAIGIFAAHAWPRVRAARELSPARQTGASPSRSR